MSTTSRHLTALADHVQAGAHVVLRGHVGDEVLVDGEIRAELWAIGQVLGRSAGIETVVVVSQARGLYCVDGKDRQVDEVMRAMNASDPDAVEGANFRATGPFQVASAIRALLRQEEMSVAVVLRDPDILGEGETEQDRRAPAVLLEAMAEAGFRGAAGNGPPVKNVLIVYGDTEDPVPDLVARVPGVVELNVELPDRPERTAALRDLAPGFFGATAERPAEEDLDALARISHGYTLRGLGQLSRRSHAVRKPVSRPETLFREARREQLGTPINRVGVKTIMEMLEDEIVGQPRAMAAICEQLERGRWRSANRPPGSIVTRPMASMVLHGPTGVGKTETGYILADAIAGSRSAVRRIDCAEFQGHDTARLTGAPPGYVGYEDGGALTDALEAEAAIVVLDEFDRGGPRLAEMLLGILDAGRLTDGRGRTFSFENVVLILTTNAGSAQSEKRTPEEAGIAAATPQAVATLGGGGGGMTGNGSAAVLPGTDELLAASAKALKVKLETPPDKGLGSPALWSRLQDSLVGYDYLRREALQPMIEKSCRHLGANLGDEFGLCVNFAVERFVTVISDRLPPDGEWDGRKIAPLVNVLLERPAREQLGSGGFEPGGEALFVPDETGSASLR